MSRGDGTADPVIVLQEAAAAFREVRRADQFRLELLPVFDDPLSVRFRADCPGWLRGLAAVSGGYRVGYEDVQWDPPAGGAVLPDVMDETVCLWEDGFGNSTVVDLVAGGVWFLCHDPPLIVLEAPTVAGWLRSGLERHLALTPLAQDDGEEAAEQYDSAYSRGLARQAGGDDRSLGPAGAIRGGDEDLRRFRAALPPSAHVLDFRGAAPGDHADLDPFLDAGSPFARAGTLDLFAVLPP